jgi:SIR2-like domain
VSRSLTETQLVDAIAGMKRHSVALLTGAGASRSSGIFLASEIIHDLSLTGYCQEYGIRNPASRERVTPQDIQSWLELSPWYSDAKVRGESEYSAVFSHFQPTYEHQISYIQGLVDKKLPSPAYQALATLSHDGYFDLLLTTNFDPFFESCYQSSFPHDRRLRTLSKPEDFLQVTIDHDRCQLAYLHGNLDGYSIANIDDDTRYLHHGIADALGRLLDPYQLVVVGYSGRDRSVMTALLQLARTRPSCFRHGVIYWCRRPGEPLSPEARELLAAVPQGFEVEIHGFDKLIERLCRRTATATSFFAPTTVPTFADARELRSQQAILNAAAVVRLPQRMFRYRTEFKDTKQIEKFRNKNSFWQATIRDGFLWLMGNPDDLSKTLRNKCSAKPVSISLNDASVMEHWHIFAELANSGIRRFLHGVLELRCWKEERFFFNKPPDADDLTIKYMSRQKNTQRKVVWKEFETNHDGKVIQYYCHEVIQARIVKFQGRPVLQISPRRLFTIEGQDVWDTPTAHTSIGRSTSKVWNYDYGSQVCMWLDVLTNHADAIKIPFSGNRTRHEYELSFHPRPIPARQVRG